MGEEEKNTTVGQEVKGENETPKAKEGGEAQVNAQTGDSSATQTEAKKAEKKPQTSEENAKFAEMRRQNEALKAENERLNNERREGVTDKVLQELELTRDDLKDESNMALAKSYMEGLTKGVENPTLYAYRNAEKMRREAQKKADEETMRKNEEANAQKIRIANDKEAFAKAYPNVDMNRVMNNSDFMNMATEMFGEDALYGNITKYYGFYLKAKGVSQPTDQAKSKSVPPTTTSVPNPSEGESLKDKLKGMSDKELDEWYRSTKKHR